MSEENSERNHYYLFSFIGADDRQRSPQYARITIGWPDAFVTESRIKEANAAAFGAFHDNACTIAVSYLGYMTPTQVKS